MWHILNYFLTTSTIYVWDSVNGKEKKAVSTLNCGSMLCVLYLNINSRSNLVKVNYKRQFEKLLKKIVFTFTVFARNVLGESPERSISSLFFLNTSAQAFGPEPYYTVIQQCLPDHSDYWWAARFFVEAICT